VLPFYLDVLSSYNFSKKSKKASMKPLDFSCVLKLSKSQLTETGFKDATVEAVYGGLLTYLADNSNKVGKRTLILATSTVPASLINVYRNSDYIFQLLKKLSLTTEVPVLP
jgi:nucleolar complex protein 2